MAENKKYYWLKLSDGFFDEDTITWLEEQQNGKDYIIFYLKLCLKSLQDEGFLIRYVGEKLIPYDFKALSKLTNTDIDTVSMAMRLFIEIGLVARLETGELYMSQIKEMIGTETDTARRVRRHRIKKGISEGENLKLLHCNIDETKCNTEIRDKRLEIRDKRLEKECLGGQAQNEETDKPKAKPKTHPPLPDNFQNLSPSLQEKLKEWLQYKLERKELYQPTGLKSLITEVQNNAKRHGDERVINVISKSMANGWKGIIWDKVTEGGYGSANAWGNHGAVPEPQIPKRQIGIKL